MIYKNNEAIKQNIEILHDLFDEIYQLDERISELENSDYIREVLDPYPGHETLNTRGGYGMLLAVHGDRIADEVPAQVSQEMYADDHVWEEYYRHDDHAGFIIQLNEIPSYIVCNYVNKFLSDLKSINEELDDFDASTLNKSKFSLIKNIVTLKSINEETEDFYSSHPELSKFS